MATFAHPPPIRVEQWAELPDDDDRELVDGRLAPQEMPSTVHDAVVTFVMQLLFHWAQANGARVFGSGLKFAMSPIKGRLPDLSVFLAGAPRPPRAGACRVPPSIAIEVVSPGAADERRDRIEKLADYAEFGVRWYWLVDPELRSFEVLELDEERRYRHMIAAGSGTVQSIPGCAGLVIDVDAVFRYVDEVVAEAGDDDASS